MYKVSEEQCASLLYIFDRLTVTGPDQAALLSNAAVIVRTGGPFWIIGNWQ